MADIGYLASTIQYCYYSPIEKKTNVIQLQYIYSWMIPLWNTFKCFSDTIVIFMTHNRYTVVSKIAQFSPGGTQCTFQGFKIVHILNEHVWHTKLFRVKP